jgi:hypothetical protein
MSLLYLECHMTEGIQMSDNDEYDYFTMTVRDSLALILWTFVATTTVVGVMLAIAL